ncbi:hypothetical protein ABTI29_20975, partial [Acinetobacter baumannii]
NDKRDNLITKLSKLDDEYNKKNLRKLSLNFEDLQEAGEKEILFFLTEEEISFSDIKTLAQFENLMTQAAIKLKGRQKSAGA